MQCQLLTSVKCVISRTACIKDIRFDRTENSYDNVHKKCLPVNLQKKKLYEVGLGL